MVPWVSSFVIVAVVFLWLYHPELGVLNDMLMRLGIADQPIAWLASPGMALFSLILANTWKFFPLVAITLFTGLQAIPRELTEASMIDGASRFETLRYIVIPLMAPSIATAVLLSAIWAFNAFTLVHHHDRRRAAARHRGHGPLHLQGGLRFLRFRHGGGRLAACCSWSS